MNALIETNVAASLRAAYRDGAIAPVAGYLPPGDVAAAYRVQDLNTVAWLGQGRRLIGRKIGLTAPAVQAQLGVDQPDYGMLFEDMLAPDGGSLSATHLIAGKVEAEIAVGLKADLIDPELDEAALLAAIDWLAPALEIVDSRIADWKISIVDTVADNASSAYFVLGSARAAPAQIDVVAATMRLRADDQVVSQGAGAACLGSPYNACLWLARTMIAVGRPLRAGDILMSGALGPMVPVTAGVRYQADIDGLGAVSIQF